jgi:hypothetical protein
MIAYMTLTNSLVQDMLRKIYPNNVKTNVAVHFFSTSCKLEKKELIR